MAIISPMTWHSVRKIERRLADLECIEVDAKRTYHVNYSGQDKYHGLDEFEALLRSSFGEDCLVEMEIKILGVD